MQILSRRYGKGVTRREMLKVGAVGLTASQIALFEQLVKAPEREVIAASLPDIQYDIGNFIAAAQNFNGIPFRFGPVFTTFTPLRLLRTPTKTDQSNLNIALNDIEQVFPFSPSGVFTFISYGIPYFNKLPGGINGSLVQQVMPKLVAPNSTSRNALEEAVPSPTDVVSGNGITKDTFNVPVRIETFDVLLTLRSDSTGNLNNILNWLFAGSNNLGGFAVQSPPFGSLFSLGTTRLMFQQNGLPRSVANNAALPYAGRIRDTSPMWMGFADQQVDGSGPAPITTFAGNGSAHLTNKVAGNYFDNGAIQHLSHVILDMAQWLATPAQDPPDGEPYTERVQYMFRSNDSSTSDGLPNDGFSDQFTNGGGPAFLDNRFQGTGDAARNAQALGTFQGQHRMGHLSALQRSSRAADGTPIHIRMDGPGFDSLDVPGGSQQPKLEFTVFVPTAEFFRVMRVNQASLDLVNANGVADDDNGLERFLTATRRQNFLVPPRRHRSFPILELT
ncbi:MAG TPA: hypothetical protein VOB72_19925 [Candidatus Dormibacteraeota bacterium]|nr:hypothetical protein [Candidatus Dormibacteraeota bacterium]